MEVHKGSLKSYALKIWLVQSISIRVIELKVQGSFYCRFYWAFYWNSTGHSLSAGRRGRQPHMLQLPTATFPGYLGSQSPCLGKPTRSWDATNFMQLCNCTSCDIPVLLLEQ